MKGTRQRVLITGAAGRIGRTLSQAFEGRYHLLRLIDRLPIKTSRPETQSITAELSDQVALSEAMKDIDCVVHLAAIPDERPFEELLEPNIMGVYHLFEAARQARIKRVIYASSIQAVGFHRMETGVGQNSRIRPSGYYGVTKAFGEALASLYADKFGISVACLRIASFEPAPQDQRQLATWLSPADCISLFKACIEAERFSFAMAYGVSANDRTVVRDDTPAAIGFRPNDNAELFRGVIGFDPELKTATTTFTGGEYCGREFVGEFDRVK